MSKVPALNIDTISFSYGKKATLKNLSFKLERGNFAVLLGENGAGKTTLFSLITRLYTPHAGSIQIYGYDVNLQSTEALKRLGVVFQQRTLDMDLTVWQNLMYFTSLHGMLRTQAKQRVIKELELFGLSEHSNEKVRKLSGGQIRRVEIARSLLHQPQLMMLDEPTAGLDFSSRLRINEHIRKLCKEEGLALLWATHLIDELELTDQVLILHHGQLIASGEVKTLIEQTGTENIQEAYQKLIGINDERKPL